MNSFQDKNQHFCTFVFLRRLQLVDRALNLLNHLTNEIIQLETHLLSQTLLLDDENSLHRQFNDLLHRTQLFEKPLTELLNLTKLLNNDRLTHITEQLTTRWKYLSTEINQRLDVCLIDLYSTSCFTIGNDRLIKLLNLIDYLKLYSNKKNALFNI